MTSDTGETNRMKPPLNRREFIAQATATAALAATASTTMAGMVRSKKTDGEGQYHGPPHCLSPCRELCLGVAVSQRVHGARVAAERRMRLTC